MVFNCSKNGKKIYYLYGVSGHGKGLVDAMSRFGVKGPIRRAVVIHDFSYKSAQNIFIYLSKLFEADNQKKHFLLQTETISARQTKNNAVKIVGCRNLHMICFFPDGSLQTKQRIYSCLSCLYGDFINCVDETGSLLFPTKKNDSDSSSCDSDSDEESIEAG